MGSTRRPGAAAGVLGGAVHQGLERVRRHGSVVGGGDCHAPVPRDEEVDGSWRWLWWRRKGDLGGGGGR